MATDTPQPLPTQSELDALVPPDDLAPDKATPGLRRVAVYWHREMRNRELFAGHYAALDPPIGLPTYERPVAAAQLATLGGMLADASGRLGVPSWGAALMGAGPLLANTPQLDFDALAPSSPALRYALDDLRKMCIRRLEEAGRAPGALVSARSYREIAASIPAGASFDTFAVARLSYAVVWPSVLAAWRDANAVLLGARYALHKEGGPFKENEDAAADLVREVERGGRWTACLAALGLPASAEDAARERDGMGELAARFSDHVIGALRLEDRDANALRAELRDEWRQQAMPDGAPSWERWRTRLHAARMLAALVWRYEVRAQVEARSERESRRGLAVLPWKSSQSIYRTYLQPGRTATMRSDGDGFVLHDKHGAPVGVLSHPSMPVELCEALLLDSVKLAMVRLVIRVPLLAHRQWLATGGTDAIALRWDRGCAEIAESVLRLGGSNQNNQIVRHVLDLGRYAAPLRVGSTTYHGLWLWDEDKPPGRPWPVTMTLGGIYTASGQGRVVPVPEREAPLVGRPRDWPAQLRLQFFLVMPKLREHAADLLPREEGGAGGVRFDPAEWRRMADAAGLVSGSLPGTLEGWQQGVSERGREAPPFLVRNGDRWTLAPAYARELDVLLEGGRQSRGASLNGQTRSRLAARSSLGRFEKDQRRRRPK